MGQVAVMLLRSVRPQQWSKNLFVFAGILFSQNLLDAALLTDRPLLIASLLWVLAAPVIIYG